MRLCLGIIILSIISFSFTCKKDTKNKDYYIDSEIKSKITQALIENYEGGNTIKMSEFYSQLDSKSCKIKFKTSQNNNVLSNTELYNKCKQGVLIIGKLFQYKQSKKLHTYIATGFVISEEGYCVSNHHVFEKSKREDIKFLASIAMDCRGNLYKIEKVCASSENNDIAIFKIKAKKTNLFPLKLSGMPKIGQKIHIISHPKSLFYKYTNGSISRHYLYEKDNSERMSVTADFAVGSSGAPILNNNGEVVGIVSSTFKIPNKRNSQMVIKEIIPINSLMKIIN